jgi:hypothetical protein
MFLSFKLSSTACFLVQSTFERGESCTLQDRLFLKALVIMSVRHLHSVHELLSVLAQPTEEMVILRQYCAARPRRRLASKTSVVV